MERYKRQLLNILYTIHSYIKIKGMTEQERKDNIVPRCVIFGGKGNEKEGRIWLSKKFFSVL